ncbi:MAG TPA: BlaI/MecI/CopY family transcriptional regulator [Bacteroidales bacterium]|nr:BlaI/MecI/CopY family transcriptional regulator [Bacteroidales bacterium]
MSTKQNPVIPSQLTRAEEEVMQILWDLEKGTVHDILGLFNPPKPAYNTVSTIIRILEQKGFVGHKAYGRTHEYFPLISKADYTKSYLRNFVRNYFGNSYKSLASFFANEGNLSLNELEDIRQTIKEEVKKQKGKKP